jgi:hypothetical protein
VRRALLLALLGALWAAAPASGHSVMKVEGGVVHYTANDDVSLNDLTVTFATNPTSGRDAIRFRDPRADGGITASDCDPGELDSSGNIIEMYCPRAGIASIRVDVGEAQDRVTAQIPLPALVLGGEGADTLTTGDANDILNGGGGNDTLRSAGGNDQLIGEHGDDTLAGEAGDDTLHGGGGTDGAEAGAGNDDLRLRDGVVDRGLCAEGDDRVQSDPDDQLDACEAVDSPGGSTPPPAPPGPGGGPARDTAAPRVRAGGSTLQRVGRSGRITVLATASEASEVVAAGYVAIGDRRFRLRSARANVTVGGGGVRLRPSLTPRAARTLWRLLRGRRRAVARVSVVATDAAGNSAAARLPPILLRR